MQKQNDWFATRLFQPDFTLVDFYAHGITPDNSTLKSKEDYKDIPEVQEYFKDKSGQFNEKEFDKFYETSLALYNQYDNDEVEKRLVEAYAHDPYEWYTPGNLTFREVGSKIVLGTNPLYESQGIEGLLYTGAGQFSIREIAQRELVKDQDGNTLDWSPNDKGGLFKALTRPTLVLAQYDEDTEEIIDGQVVKHKKGDLKFNENGRPYYEILGDREMYGKDLLHYTDTLTIDGKGLNAIDVFDNDGLNKSIGGTLMKTALTIGPLLIPGVGPVYGAIRAGIATAQVLPILGKTLNSIFTGDNDNAFGDSLNKLESWTAQFSPSVSDVSREKVLTIENFGSLINQIGGQLFEQRAISYIPRLLNKTGDIAKTGRAGQQLAQTYMAVTSARETYQSFKEAGATDQMAGVAMAANVLALYKLMNIDYFRKTLFRGSFMDDDVVKVPSKNVANKFRESLMGTTAKDVVKEAEDQTKQQVKKNFKQWTTDFMNSISKGLNKSEFVSRSAAEGVEEVMEEAVSDASKALTLGLEALGLNVGEQKLDFGFSAQDILTRYGMAFGGGMIGGALFQGFGKWEKMLNPHLATMESMPDLEKMTYLIAEGRGDDIRKYVQQWQKKGRLGSTNLSATEGHTLTLPGKSGEWVANVDSSLTQNDAVAQAMYNYVDYIENLLAEEGLMNMVQKAPKILADIPEDLNDNAKKATIINLIGAQSGMLRDLNRLSAKIVKKRAELDKISESIKSQKKNDSTEETQSVNEKLNNNQQIKQLQTELAQLRAERDKVLNGERNSFYIGRGLFNLDEGVAKQFLNLSKEDFAQNSYGINYGSLTTDQKQVIDDLFNDYAAEEVSGKLDIAYKIYLKLQERYTPKLLEINEKLKTSKKNDRYTDTLYAQSRTQLAKEWEETRQQLNPLLGKDDLTEEEKTQKNQLSVKFADLTVQIQRIDANPGLFLERVADKDSDELKFQNAILNDLPKINEREQLFKEVSKITHLSKEKLLVNPIFQTFALYLAQDPYWQKELVLPEITDPSTIDKVSQNIVEQVWNRMDQFSEIKRQDEERRNTEIGQVGNLIKNLYQNYKSSKTIVTNDSELLRFYDWIRNTYKSKNTVANRLKDYITNWWNEQGVEQGDLETVAKYLKPKKKADGSLDWGDPEAIFNSSVNSRLQAEFVSKVENFINNFGINNTLAVEALNEAYEILKNKTALDESEIKKLMDYLIPKVGDTSVTEFIQQIDDIRKDIQYSPFNELFKEYVVDLTGTKLPILDILKAEELRLAQAPNLMSYQIENPFVKQDLENALTLIDSLIGTITGAYDGLNSTINPYRQKAGENLLATIDENTAQILYQDAVRTKQKIASLLQISKMNGQNKLDVQKKIAANMRPKYIKALVSPAYAEQIHKITGIDLAQLWKQISNEKVQFDAINKDNYEQYEPSIIAFETAIYDQLRNLTEDQYKELMRSIFTADIAKMRSTRLTDDVKEELTSYDLAVYLTTILSLNSNDFYYKLKEILNTPEFDKAPLFGQEFAIRVAYANALHPEKFNSLLNLFTELNKDTPEIAEKAKLYNSSFIFGGAGVGKTVVIARLLARLLDSPDSEFLLLAPSETQVKKLKDSIGLSEEQVRTKSIDDLFKEITSNPNGIEKTNIEKVNNRYLKPKKISAKATDSVFSISKKRKYIIMDEVACFNSVQLQLLSDWAKKNDVIIIGLGDQKQISAKITYQTGLDKNGKPILHSDYAGVEDCLLIKSPALTASLRASNIAKLDNYNVLDYKLSKILDEYALHPEYDSLKLSAITDAQLQEGINLYYDTSNDRIVGEKAVKDSTELINYINKVKKLGGSIVIYADDPSKYTTFKNDSNITILPPTNINGGEYSYTFVDIDWKKRADIYNNGNINKFALLQDLYTITQRSTVATVFVNNGLITDESNSKEKGLLNITNRKSANANALPELTKDSINSFKQERIEALKGLTHSSDYELNLSPSYLKDSSNSNQKVPESKPKVSENEPKEPEAEIPESRPEPKKLEPPLPPPIVPESRPTVEEVITTIEDKVKSEWIDFLNSNPDFKNLDYWKVNRSKITDALLDIATKNKLTNANQVLDDFLVAWWEGNIYPEITSEPETTNESATPQREATTVETRQVSKIQTRNNDYQNFLFSKNLINFEINENENSLLKLFNNQITSETYAKLINTISSIVLTNDDIQNFIPVFHKLLQNDSQQRNQGWKGRSKLIQILEDPNTVITKQIRYYKEKQGMLFLDIDNGINRYSIPITIVNTTTYGEYTGDFIQVRSLVYGKSGQVISLAALKLKYPGLQIGNNWGIVSVKNIDEMLEDPNLSQTTKEFLARNNGKLMVMSSADALDDSTELRSYWQDAIGEGENDTTYTYRNHEHIKIFGVQKIVSMSDIVRYATAMTMKNFQYRNKFSQDYLKALGLDYDSNGILQNTDVFNLTGNALELAQLIEPHDKALWGNFVKRWGSREYAILPFDRLGKFNALVLGNNLKDTKTLSQIRQNVFNFFQDSNGYTALRFYDTKTKNSYLIWYDDSNKTYNVYSFNDNTHKITGLIKTYPSTTLGILDQLNTIAEELNIEANDLGLYLETVNAKENSWYTVPTNASIALLFNNVTDLDELDSIIDQNTQFAYGIYVNDKAGDFYEGSSFYREFTGNTENYITDADIWYFPDYALDTSKIKPIKSEETPEDIRSVEYNTKVETIKQTLINNGFENVVKEYEKEGLFNHNELYENEYETELNSLYNGINETLKFFYVKGDKYPRLAQDFTSIEWIKDSINAFHFAFNKGTIQQIIPLTDVSKSVTNFGIFAVTDQENLINNNNIISLKQPISEDNSTFWIYTKTGDIIDIWETKTYPTWKQLYDYVNSLDVAEKDFLLSYIESLYTDISYEQDLQLRQFAQQNPEVYKKFEELLNNHLQDRLTKKEC